MESQKLLEVSEIKDTFYIKNITAIIGFFNTPMNPLSLQNIYSEIYFDILKDGIPKMIRSIRNQGYFFHIINITAIIGFIDTPMNLISLHNTYLGLYFDILKDGIPKMIKSISNQGYFFISKI